MLRHLYKTSLDGLLCWTLTHVALSIHSEYERTLRRSFRNKGVAPHYLHDIIAFWVQPRNGISGPASSASSCHTAAPASAFQQPACFGPGKKAAADPFVKLSLQPVQAPAPPPSAPVLSLPCFCFF